MLAAAPIMAAMAAIAQTPPSPAANEQIGGVGIALRDQGADMVVGEVLPDLPAAASKLIHKGDRILAIAEGEEPSQSIAGKTMTETVTMMRGKIGTNVRLTVAPEGADDREARDILLTRDRLNLAPVPPPEDDAAKAAPAVPGAANPGLDFQRLPGGEADKLSSYRGKIVVLEFWATWSAPCQGAMADFQRTAAQWEKLRGKVAFIAVSMDRGKEIPAARVKENGWTETLNGWAAREALAPWRIRGLPTTYVIDADGQIIAGSARMTQQMLEDVVTPLLKN